MNNGGRECLKAEVLGCGADTAAINRVDKLITNRGTYQLLAQPPPSTE
jgi:hypothetical protein